MTDERPLDLLGIAIKRWLTLAIFTVTGTAAAIGYSFVVPEWYSATLTVVQSQRSPDSAMLGLAAKLPFGLESSSDVQRIQAVLTSNSVTDDVIDKFKLQARYDESHREQTRKTLWEHCSTSVDRKSSVVALICEDTDPVQAQALATYFGEVGNRVFGRVSASSARDERRFLETQVKKSREDVDDASRKLREFQEEHKVVDLPEQSKAVISAMASIKGEMLSKQIELSYLSSFSGRTESTVLQLQQQIAIMAAKMKQLEDVQTMTSATGSGSAMSSEFFPGALSVPAIRFELEQLMREQKVRETVFSLMTQRYEMAKVDEARDTAAFQILDYPTLPTYRSRPARKRFAAMGMAAGFVLGLTFILAPVLWKRRMTS